MSLLGRFRNAGRTRTLVAVLLALLAVTSTMPLPVGATNEPTDETAAELGFDHTFERLPDRPGFVRVTVETTPPDSVTETTVELPEEADVVAANGYEQTSDAEWRWSRESGVERPTLTYVVNVEQRDDGSLEGTSTGEWALFNWRQVDVEWSYTKGNGAPEVAVVERGSAAGEGVVGTGYAYLGPYDTETRTVADETIRVVVPEAADMHESPEAVADALAVASDDLRVGARNDRLTVFVAPAEIDATGRLSRAEVDGRQDTYVSAEARLDTADNAWFHEYVHSRQSYETSERMSWFDDASAEYYGARLAYEGGHVSAEAFYDYVRTDEESDAVLAQSESVNDSASYAKGMRVLAALDAEIVRASGGEQSLEDVFAAMNAHEGSVDVDTFAGFVEDSTGDSRDRWLATYVGTDATPNVPALGSEDESGVVATLQREFVATTVVGALLFTGGVVIAASTLLRRRG